VSKPRLDDMTEPQLRELMNTLARGMTSILRHVDGPPKFSILVFNDPTLVQYVSSCRREDMIRALREAADRLERKEEVSRVAFSKGETP